jgi:signal transduction histidine kinase/ActR/RegA family two-component response regulator
VSLEPSLEAATCLEWVARAAELLLRDGVQPSVEEHIARAPVAVGIFAWPGLAPVSVSSVWQDMFGGDVPAGVHSLMEIAGSAGDPARRSVIVYRRSADAIERGCRMIARPAGSGAVLAAAFDVTDELLVQRLGASPHALIWSARVAAPIDYANRAWSTYIGSEPQREWRAIIHPDDVATCEKAAESTDFEARLRASHGEYRWHRIRYMFTDGGKRWIASAVDIHEAHAAAVELARALARERTARADAERANASKDQFLAVVSHELRAPVATLMMWEKVLRDHADDPELRQRSLDAIRASAASQARLVADLLDVSRAVSGKFHVERRRITLDDVLNEALQSIAPIARAKRVDLIIDCPRKLGRIRGDSSRLLQVFENLLSNAVKFTSGGGTIKVTAQRQGGMLVIAIADTGIGIPPDLMPRIFVPFSQSDDVMTRAQGGLGLGLAIAREIVAQHDGELTAASDGPGKGSTFTVKLPPATRRAQSTPVGVAAVKNARLDGVRILVIDDDEALRSALTTLLHRAGAIVEVAASAAEAREKLAIAEPQVILCDIAMPEEDGYTFVRKLRSQPNGKKLPALALTAYASELDRMDAAAAGFDRHIAKPVEFELLVETIEGVLAEKASTQNA